MQDSVAALTESEDVPDVPETSPPSHATARRAVSWVRSRRPISRGFAAFLLYALISVGWYGHNVLPHFAGRWCLGRCATDTNYYAWSLQWMSYALAHGLNPFHTNVLAAPGSVDLTWVVTIPGPALILTPLTGLFGPVASNNVLLLAGPPLAAWAAYLVCNQVTRRFWPSVVGGLVFGYSPYVGRFMFAQLHTLLVFPTALAVYLVLRRIDGSLGKRAFLALFSLALFGELFISVEVFASMTLFGAIALLGVFAFEPGRLRRAVLSVARLIAVAYLIVAVVASPYLIELFRNRPSGSIRDPSKTSIDLIRFLVPQRGAWVGGRRWFDGIGHMAIWTGEMAYLGPVFLLILILFAWEGRRRRATWFLVGFVAVCAVLALGPRLHIDGTKSIPMPGALITGLPFMNNSLPQRWSVFMWLTIAVITALWLTRGRRRTRWVRYALVGMALVFTMMKIAYVPAPTSLASVPTFFTDGTYRSYLHPGEIVFPMTKHDGADFMWQATADMYFRVPQGSWPLVRLAEGSNHFKTYAYGVSPPREISPPSRRSLEKFLEEHKVDAIVAEQGLPPSWTALLRSAASSEPVTVGGVSIYRVGIGG